jgi:hypothetical protein
MPWKEGLIVGKRHELVEFALLGVKSRLQDFLPVLPATPPLQPDPRIRLSSIGISILTPFHRGHVQIFFR